MQPPSPCHSSTLACHRLTNSLLQLFVINYVFGSGVSLQETKILPQQSRNSVFSLSSLLYSSCKHLCASESKWDLFSFWPIVLSVSPQGFRLPHQSLCQRAAHLDLLHSKVLWNFVGFRRFGRAQVCNAILKIPKEVLFRSFPLLE